MRVNRSSVWAASTPGKIKNTASQHGLKRRVMSRSHEAKCHRPQADTHCVAHGFHLGARLAIGIVNHADGSMCDGATRPGHLDEDFHFEFVASAAQRGCAKFLQPE